MTLMSGLVCVCNGWKSLLYNNKVDIHYYKDNRHLALKDNLYIIIMVITVSNNVRV